MILAILQARFSSSRLPGKVLKHLLGEPMLARQIERVRRARRIDRLVVATSTEASDDAIADLCNVLNVDCYRGSLDDVLDRYYQAALRYRPDHVVRLTGDCPLIDPAVIDLVVERHLADANDYTSNTQPPTFPDGLDVEVVRFATLRRAWQEATLPSQREHVTYYVYTTMLKVRVGQLQGAIDWSALRWTVDEPADFEFVEQVYGALYPQRPDFDMQAVLDLLRDHPALLTINHDIERNEGLRCSLEREGGAGSRGSSCCRYADYPLGVHLVQDMVSYHAACRPTSVLVHDAEGTVSYGEMDAFTNRLARYLIAQGVERSERVAFFMDKSRRSFQAMLGILKADATYVPLDFQAPAERVRRVLADCDCRLLITDADGLSKALEVVVGLAKVPTILLLGAKGISADVPPKLNVIAAGDLASFEPTRRHYRNLDVDLAYIVYTSGSTGTPKGVMIRHASVLDYARWTVSHFGVEWSDRLSSHAGLHFDLSVFDVYTAFMAGASLHPVPRSASLFPIKFMEFVEERGITIWCSVPSFLTYVAKARVLALGRMPSLRAVTFCGEVMPTPTIISWMSTFPGVRYVNQYGPSETTCASMYYEIEEVPSDPSVPLPIGCPIPNSEVFAITERGDRAGMGDVGELYIRGIGNSPGYWNSPEKTERAFVQNPLVRGYVDVVYASGDLVRVRQDGLYDFVGRRDTQIKYMGYRIELGDIEAALASIIGVQAAAVVAAREPLRGEQLIAAFVVAPELGLDALRAHLQGALPAYMIPKRLELVDALPQNASGKVDRLLLTRRAEGDATRAC